MMEKKGLFTAYLLWLIGGFWGLHHFYLGRDRHGFLYLISCGGYFGAGWFRDLWRIPTYVKDANDDPQYLEKLAAKMRAHPRPPHSFIRTTATIFVADGLGYLAKSALPMEYIPEFYQPFAAVIIPFAVAVGIHLVGNIGRERGNFSYALIGSYITYPIYFYTLDWVVMSTIISLFIFTNYGKQWRRHPPSRKHPCRRLFIISVCFLLYLSLWFSFFYFNCTVTSKDGDEVKCRDAVKHFFGSRMWKEFLAVMQDIWQFAQYHGWKEVWRHVIDAFDPQGHTHAFEVLGLNKTATQQEITSQYRKLSRQWHPDKHKDPVEKAHAQEMFIEIQQAYELLSKIKSDRMAINLQTCEGDDCYERKDS